MFRFKRGIKNIDYNRQGYIYFATRCYATLPKRERDRIDRLIEDCGGDIADALRDFLIAGKSATWIEQRHYIGRGALYRAVRKYYQRF